ncbi:MAG: nuclear transport factor 2 family protein [Steroidobacteraceae bacterium]
MSDFPAADSAIRQLHARYVDAVWRKDFAAFADCFAEDAAWKIAGMHMRGRAQIQSQFAKFIAPSERVLMLLGMPILEVGNGTAIGRILVTEYIKLTDNRAARTIGVYYDRYVDQGDRWRFQSRHWNLYYRGPTDLSAPFYECEEYGPPPGMPDLEQR